MNINVDDLVLTVRERVREQARRVASKSAAGLANSTSSRPVVSTERIQSALTYFQSEAARLGAPTPEPPTLRGRVGGTTIRLISRILWWYTHELGAIFSSLAHLHREQLTAITDVAEALAFQRASSDFEGIKNWLERQIAAAVDAERTATRKSLRDANEKLALAEARLALMEEKLQASFELNQTHSKTVAEINERVGEALASQSSLNSDLAERNAKMAADIAELGVANSRARAGSSLQDRRITYFIEEARKRLPQPLSREQIDRLSDVDQHKHDSLYVDFEDVFRGSRTEISARQSAYLPLLREHQVGTENRPLLDLGCGRGEWLHLLRENQMFSLGVDRNDRMMELCRGEGLDVSQGDALEHLRSFPDEVLGAVSSFHMVEHLPFDRVLAIVDECLRVLRPGGILILETPNPQNLQVGAHTFYFDPTHLRPLPSGMLQFFVEARGFCRVEIRELHNYAATMRFPVDGSIVTSRLNDLLYGPQDYAVIGVKP